MHNYREFTIERQDYFDTIKVRVYKTARSLRKACEEFTGIKGSHSETDGSFASTVPNNPTNAEGKKDRFMFGIIMLCEQYMEMQIIVHECIHATFKHEKNIIGFRGNYSNDEHEERFGYYYEWLLLEVLKTLKKAGYRVKVP